MLKYKLTSGPYKGKSVFLGRLDKSNHMRFVRDSDTHELLLVDLSEISQDPLTTKVKRYKLKIRK